MTHHDSTARHGTLALTALLLAALLVLSGCDFLPFLPGHDGADTKTIHFKGHAVTDLVQEPFPAPDRCGPFDPDAGQFNLLNLQAGSGFLRGIGPVEVNFEFCVDVADLFDNGVLDTGIPYGPGKGTFTTRNGDQFMTNAEGIVLPNDDPDFDFKFHDTLSIIGGTGRFAGATGAVELNSVVDNDHVLDDGTIVSRTFHRITGHVTLPRRIR